MITAGVDKVNKMEILFLPHGHDDRGRRGYASQLGDIHRLNELTDSAADAGIMGVGEGIKQGTARTVIAGKPETFDCEPPSRDKRIGFTVEAL